MYKSGILLKVFNEWNTFQVVTARPILRVRCKEATEVVAGHLSPIVNHRRLNGLWQGRLKIMASHLHSRQFIPDEWRVQQHNSKHTLDSLEQILTLSIQRVPLQTTTIFALAEGSDIIDIAAAACRTLMSPRRRAMMNIMKEGSSS